MDNRWRRRFMLFSLSFGVFSFSLCSARDASTAEFAPTPIVPMQGCGWLTEKGMRAAWISYKQINDESIDQLHRARVNTVFLKHGLHDFLDLETARWEGDLLMVDPVQRTQTRILNSTRQAASHGIHVFWVANYELEIMLPHLQRLKYQTAYAEGPGRYLRSGPHKDAAPLDRTFWRGITGAHGELVARLSRNHPIDGLLYDTEHYAGGMMYLQNAGFSDATYNDYVQSRNLGATARQVPAGKRYPFLRGSGNLTDYYYYLEEQAYRQGRDLANRWHAINPHLILGTWPLLDNWFSQGFLRGLGGAIPSIGLSGVEYYHGADQTAAMAQYFESRNRNLMYLPGFYPPFAYSPDELRIHVARALKGTGHYWMLGPHAELEQVEYQTALRQAWQQATHASSNHAVDLDYVVRRVNNEPVLVVTANSLTVDVQPRLSLTSSFGGSPLCEQLKMRPIKDNVWQARVPLVRRITDNLGLPDRFRSGATYRLDPVPREYRYEDPHHTKLTDGRAYGYFGTTVAWSKSINQASVYFDLHREYQILRVEIAQPTKLEDRQGGPTLSRLHLGSTDTRWQSSFPFQPQFGIESKLDTPPSSDLFDRRHSRGWLSWRAEPDAPARYLRIDLERTRPNSSISLGEVVVSAIFTGEVQAVVESAGKRFKVNRGRHWSISLN